MSRFFFSGSYAAKLDEKSRFVLPQPMRFGLVEEGRLEFSIALGLGGCLAIYKTCEMDRIVERFRAKEHVAKFQKFFTLFFSTLHQLTCDKVGRVLLPPQLKKLVNIKNEVVIAGVLNKIEIWPKERYDDQFAGLLKDTGAGSEFVQISEEAFALLEEGEGEDVLTF